MTDSANSGKVVSSKTFKAAIAPHHSRSARTRCRAIDTWLGLIPTVGMAETMQGSIPNAAPGLLSFAAPWANTSLKLGSNH